MVRCLLHLWQDGGLVRLALVCASRLEEVTLSNDRAFHFSRLTLGDVRLRLILPRWASEAAIVIILDDADLAGDSFRLSEP